jgi:aspartate/methionine/tyrosine aminotransferase
MRLVCTTWIELIKYVRSIVNEAAQASPVQPIVNMGQGFFGYNPPQFVLDAAHDALGKVECNQYSPTKVCCTNWTHTNDTD